jgi:hypothetical protein
VHGAQSYQVAECPNMHITRDKQRCKVSLLSVFQDRVPAWPQACRRPNVEGLASGRSVTKIGSGQRLTFLTVRMGAALLWRRDFHCHDVDACWQRVLPGERGGPWISKARSTEAEAARARESLTTGCICTVPQSHSRSGGSAFWYDASHDDGSECNANSGCRASGTYGFAVAWGLGQIRGGRMLVQRFVLAIVPLSALKSHKSFCCAAAVHREPRSTLSYRIAAPWRRRY